jgi:hypothetical protein
MGSIPISAVVVESFCFSWPGEQERHRPEIGADFHTYLGKNGEASSETLGLDFTISRSQQEIFVSAIDTA